MQAHTNAAGMRLILRSYRVSTNKMSSAPRKTLCASDTAKITCRGAQFSRLGLSPCEGIVVLQDEHNIGLRWHQLLLDYLSSLSYNLLGGFAACCLRGL